MINIIEKIKLLLKEKRERKNFFIKLGKEIIVLLKRKYFDSQHKRKR